MAYAKREVFRKLEIKQIDPPGDITRMEITDVDIAELASSIEEQGLLQPILVNKAGDRFEIVAGHRRYLAHKLLKRARIMCKVVDIDPETVALQRAMENLQRKDLSPLEEGVIYFNLNTAHGLSIDNIAKRSGLSAGVVRRRMDILNMPELLQKAVHEKKVNATVAEELMMCGDPGHRDYLIQMASEHGVTRDVVRLWVSDWKKGLRAGKSASEGGGGVRSILEPEIIYRACDVCKGPVDLAAVRELRMCPGCYRNIKNALGKGGENVDPEG